MIDFDNYDPSTAFDSTASEVKVKRGVVDNVVNRFEHKTYDEQPELDSKLESFLEQNSLSWSKQVSSLVVRVGERKNMSELATSVLSLRQRIVDEMYRYSDQIIKLEYAKATATKKILDVIGNPAKQPNTLKLSNFNDKKMYIEASVKDVEYKINLLTEYKWFLNNSIKTLDETIYSIRHIVMEENKGMFV
jgi:hypothetical protein